MNPKTIGLVLLEHVTAVDVTGPAEAFGRTNIQVRNQSASGRRFPDCYRVLTLGVNAGRCVTECGIVIEPHLNLEKAPALDTLFICGGSRIHPARQSGKLGKWLKVRLPLTRRVVAIGSGIYELAATGLVDGRQVAIHWRLADDLARRFPNVRVNRNALFIKDGPFYSCAGGASAIDLSLSLIEEDLGHRIALNLARELVLHVKRSGAQLQYSEALQFQVQSSDRFTDLPAWILCNLNQDLTVESLAHKACMSPRNFSRLFKAVVGETPADFVSRARITEARERLLIPRTTIENVATSVGFKSVDAFSRTFEKVVGIRPSTYRGSFTPLAANRFMTQRARLSLARA